MDTQEDQAKEGSSETTLEMELCWCIDQLNLSLGTGKLNEKQGLSFNKVMIRYHVPT